MQINSYDESLFFEIDNLATDLIRKISEDCGQARRDKVGVRTMIYDFIGNIKGKLSPSPTQLGKEK